MRQNLIQNVYCCILHSHHTIYNVIQDRNHIYKKTSYFASGFSRNAPLWHTVRCHSCITGLNVVYLIKTLHLYFFHCLFDSAVSYKLYSKPSNLQRKMFNWCSINNRNKTSNNLRTRDWSYNDCLCRCGFRKLTDVVCDVLLSWLLRLALSYTDLPELKVDSMWR